MLFLVPVDEAERGLAKKSWSIVICLTFFCFVYQTKSDEDETWGIFNAMIKKMLAFWTRELKEKFGLANKT